MCIIIAKPAGQNLPPLSHIENSFINNPDGFACIWEQKGKIKQYKTLEYSDCISFYCNLLKNKEAWVDTPFSFHFRFATHGSKTIDNCHAYVDDNNVIGFQHNGVLSYRVPKEQDITDSEYFFRNIFLPIFRMFGMKQDIVDNLTENGYNKFSFIYDRTIYLFGNFSEVGGCYYSNSGYLPYSYKSYFKNGNAYQGKSKKHGKKKAEEIEVDIDYEAAYAHDEIIDYKYSLPCDSCVEMDCNHCDLWRNM